MQSYLTIKKNEIMPFWATWVDLESVITYWIKYVREGEISYDIPYRCNLKNEINELTYKQKETHRLRQRTYGFWGEGWEEGIVRECGIDMYILLYLKQITNKDLFCTAHGILCDSLDGRGLGENGYKYVWLGLFTVHLKPSQRCLLFGYTPIQN